MLCSSTRRYSLISTLRSQQAIISAPSERKLPSHSTTRSSSQSGEYPRIFSSGIRSKYARRLMDVSSWGSSHGSCSKFQTGWAIGTSVISETVYRNPPWLRVESRVHSDERFGRVSQQIEQGAVGGAEPAGAFHLHQLHRSRQSRCSRTFRYPGSTSLEDSIRRAVFGLFLDIRILPVRGRLAGRPL